MTTSLRIPGLVLTDHVLTVPLDHDRPDAGSIEVFAREVAAPDGLDRPFLVFLQGGPGQEAPRPTNRPGSPPCCNQALERSNASCGTVRGRQERINPSAIQPIREARLI